MNCNITLKTRGGWNFFRPWKFFIVDVLGGVQLYCPLQLQCSAVQCSAVQCSLVLLHYTASFSSRLGGSVSCIVHSNCSVVQCSAVQCSAVQFYCIALRFLVPPEEETLVVLQLQCSAVQCSAVLLRCCLKTRSPPLIGYGKMGLKLWGSFGC